MTNEFMCYKIKYCEDINSIKVFLSKTAIIDPNYSKSSHLIWSADEFFYDGNRVDRKNLYGDKYFTPLHERKEFYKVNQYFSCISNLRIYTPQNLVNEALESFKHSVGILLDNEIRENTKHYTESLERLMKVKKGIQ